jgi:HEAT repeat protein
MRRARTQARRTGDLPVVLACDLDLERLRRQRDVKRAVCKGGIIAVDGPVPEGVLRDDAFADMATVPGEVADWLNDLLHLKPPDSVKPKHPGIVRLSRWVNARAASEPEATLLCSELIERARRWLPEYFARAHVAVERLRRRRHLGFVEYEVDLQALEPDPREAQALEWLDAPRADQRVRGLSLLAEIHDPDLFDWCAMFAGDENETVQIAALRTMLLCQDGVPEVVEPFAASEDRRVRAAAIAALARFAEEDSPRWIERGLKDPEVCVRVEAARFLGTLDRRRHRSILNLARQDPNPDVARRAQRLLTRR